MRMVTSLGRRRGRIGRFLLVLVGAAALSAGFATAISAGTVGPREVVFTVTSTGDQGDGAPGDGTCLTAGRVCTLPRSSGGGEHGRSAGDCALRPAAAGDHQAGRGPAGPGQPEHPGPGRGPVGPRCPGPWPAPRHPARCRTGRRQRVAPSARQRDVGHGWRLGDRRERRATGRRDVRAGGLQG